MILCLKIKLFLNLSPRISKYLYFNRKSSFTSVLFGSKGKSFAFNKGLAIAKNDLVANVDADSYPKKDALSYVVGYFDDAEVGAVTTKMIVKNPKTIVEYFQDIEYIFSNLLLVGFESLDSIYVARGPLSVYRTNLLKKIGGFYRQKKHLLKIWK